MRRNVKTESKQASRGWCKALQPSRSPRQTRVELRWSFETGRAAAIFSSLLDVEVERELVGVRALAHLVDFGGSFVVDVGLDEFLGEDVVLGEEVVVVL